MKCIWFILQSFINYNLSETISVGSGKFLRKQFNLQFNEAKISVTLLYRNWNFHGIYLMLYQNWVTLSPILIQTSKRLLMNKIRIVFRQNIVAHWILWQQDNITTGQYHRGQYHTRNYQNLKKEIPRSVLSVVIAGIIICCLHKVFNTVCWFSPFQETLPSGLWKCPSRELDNLNDVLARFLTLRDHLSVITPKFDGAFRCIINDA